MRLIRWYRWRRRALLLVAALPVFQATSTCTVDQIAGAISQQVGFAVFNLFVSSMNQVLVTSFPSSDIIQTLFGTNRQPFFTG